MACLCFPFIFVCVVLYENMVLNHVCSGGLDGTIPGGALAVGGAVCGVSARPAGRCCPPSGPQDPAGSTLS